MASAGGLTTQSCGSSDSPGHVAIHRLTNDEYDNTVQDLLYTTSTPATQFDPSPAGQSGFSNDSNALILSDDLTTSYYQAGEALAQAVIASKGTAGGAYSQIVTCAPAASCAQTMDIDGLTGTDELPVVRDMVPAVQLTRHGGHGDRGPGSGRRRGRPVGRRGGGARMSTTESGAPATTADASLPASGPAGPPAGRSPFYDGSTPTGQVSISAVAISAIKGS